MLNRPVHVSPLQARKRLLIAESELNRSDMSREWQTVQQGAHELAKRARTLGAWAALGSSLLASWGAYRQGNSLRPSPKRSWLDTALQTARITQEIWALCRTRPG